MQKKAKYTYSFVSIVEADDDANVLLPTVRDALFKTIDDDDNGARKANRDAKPLQTTRSDAIAKYSGSNTFFFKGKINATR